MPSGLRKTTGNHFEIYYEQPWGGVASDKDPIDINDGQLVTQQGAVVIDSVLCACFIATTGNQFKYTPAVTGSYIVLVFGMNGGVFGIDQFSYMYYLHNDGAPTFGSTFIPIVVGTPVHASDGPWPPGQPPTAVQVINGVAYIANFYRNSLYAFDGSVNLVFQTDYTGGLIFGVLDDYLLQFNTNNVVDDIQPNRINWSGPGKFSTWDPSLDRTAGFNTLAAIEDQLTGFLSYASVGVAISRKGLIELSPTGVAIGPFTFTALWTSQIGQGSIYPYTITQYGQKGFLVTDSDIYSVSTGAGFIPISGSARSAIMNDVRAAKANLNLSSSTVSANVSIYYLNGNYPTPFYIIATANTTGLSCWILDLTTNTWQNITFAIANVVAVSVVSTDTYTSEIGFPLPGERQFATPFTIINITTLTSPNFGTTFAYLYIYKKNLTIPDINPGPLNLVFKRELIKLYREPTIRRVVIHAYGIGTLTLSIDGVSFGTIVLDGTQVGKTYISTKGIYTGESPQLTITCPQFNGVLIKAMLVGTYADGDID